MEHTSTAKYWDLLVVEDGLALDVAGQPVLVEDADCIAQDLVHMIRESGLLVELVANRSESLRNKIFQELIVRVEDDRRIVPGSVFIEEPKPGALYLIADTVDFGQLQRELVVQDDR